MFHCPHCGNTLTRGSLAGQREFVWACQHCGGRAVNLPVMRQTVARNIVNNLWQRVQSQPHRGQRPCPACGLAMRALALRSPERDFEIDACRACQWFWFDPDEFDLLPSPPVRTREKPLSPAAYEVVARWEIERLRNRESKISNEPPDHPLQHILGLLGLPVEHDHPVSIQPWLTWGLAAVVIVVFLLGAPRLELVISNWGFVPAQPWRHAGMTWLTAFFLHGGTGHLLGNLYFLLVFGDNTEEFLGRRRYALLLLAATTLGNLLHGGLGGASDTPCVGSSGGISGVIAFYALQFPQARLGLLFHWLPLRWTWLSLPASSALILWLAYQLLGVALQLGGLSNVSALAHLGGALAGFIAWVLIRRGGGNTKPA